MLAIEKRLLLILGLVCCLAVFVVQSMPTDKQSPSKPQKEEKNIELENELDNLKADGVEISKSQKVVSKNVNGKTESQKIQKETIADAKTGVVVAEVEKTETKDDNGVHKDAQIVVPAAGIDEELHGADAENLNLIPPEEVAKYIFDTSDVDGVESTIGDLVEKKKMSKKAAENYMDQIADHLNTMHETALHEMATKVEKQKQVENQAFDDMLEMADSLNTNADTEEALYNYVKKLYMLYKTEGDEYAKEILTKYTASVQKAGESGVLNEMVQDNIFSIILQALNDVNAELGTQTDEKKPVESVAQTSSEKTKNQQASSKQAA